MKKAWLLLKASRTMVGENNRIALIIFTALVWVLAAAVIGIATFTLMAYKQDSIHQADLGITLLPPTCMVIGYGIARSIYTGFTEVKKESGKSNFKAWAMQLPVSKEDVIKAQFIDLLLCTFPALLIIVYMIVSIQLFGGSTILKVYTGITVLILSVLFLATCFEKRLLTYFFINSRIRETYYVGVAALSAFIIYMPREVLGKIKGFQAVTYSGVNSKSLYYMIQGLNFLGSLWGIVALILTGMIGYYLSCYIPKKIYRLKEGRK